MNTDAQALAASSVPNQLSSARRSPTVSARAPTRRSAARPRSRIPTASSTCCRAPTWSSSPPAWAAAPAPAPRPWSLRSPRNWTRSPSPWSPSPSRFEGAAPHALAEEGLAELAGTVDTVITIPNDRLLQLVPRGTSFFEAFARRRSAAPGRAGHQRHHHHARHDQPRFLRHRSHHAGHGLRHDGHGDRRAARTRPWTPRGRPSIARCSKIRASRGARGILINITGSSRLGLARSQRSLLASSAKPPITKTCRSTSA